MQDDSKSVSDHDGSSIWSAMTPSGSVGTDPRDTHGPLNDNDLLNDDDPLGDDDLLDDDPCSRFESSPFLVPWPDSTFIIRCVESRRVITLLDGQIVLSQPGGPGSVHWACVETKGWLGFRNTVSGTFLGHDKNGWLQCSAKRHLPWEYFNVRMKPEGGCVLLMTHFDKLWHVGIGAGPGAEKLAKIAEGGSGGIAWEFVKV